MASIHAFPSLVLCVGAGLAISISACGDPASQDSDTSGESDAAWPVGWHDLSRGGGLLPNASSNAATPDDQHPVTDNPDADIVLVFPALTADDLEEQWQAMFPWIKAQAQTGLTVVALPLFNVADGEPTDADLRAYLAANFTDRRSSATAGGRYLGLLGLASVETDPGAVLPAIPRFSLKLDALDEVVPTDLPYGDPFATAPITDLAPTAYGDFDLVDPTFLVFRVPAASVADLATFSERALAFGAAAYRDDALLVAGSISALRGDSTLVQCNVARGLADAGVPGQVFKVFDADSCDPDLVLVQGGDRLPDFLADTDSWRGGVVYDISHGSGEAIYFQGTDGELYENLSVADAEQLPTDKLNVFVSLACDVDGTVGSAWNLNRVLVDRGSVTTVAATVPTYFEPGINDVVKIETEALPILMAGGGTLLQNIATVRGDYDTLTQGYSDEDRVYTWSNLLSLNVTGDGLVRLGP